MKLQFVSDLHLERFEHHAADLPLTHAEGAMVLVLAGDIDRGAGAIERFRDWPIPVLYVAGNHEFYHQTWEDVRHDLRLASDGTRVIYLDNDVVEWGNVRFLGTTLWTDFVLPGSSPDDVMREVDRQLGAHPIHTRDGPMNSHGLLAEHVRARRWLDGVLDRPFAGSTVVISHHGPHPSSIHPRYAADPLNSAFVSDLTPLLAKVDLWLHGHVHDSADYTVGRCRVVANPAGYARFDPTEPRPRFENSSFDPQLVLAVPT